MFREFIIEFFGIIMLIPALILIGIMDFIIDALRIIFTTIFNIAVHLKALITKHLIRPYFNLITALKGEETKVWFSRRKKHVNWKIY